MLTIKFNNTSFDLVDAINVNATRLQATVYKQNHTVDEIASVVSSAEIIKVYDGETLIGQYTGYTSPIAFTLHDDTVSIELLNADYEAALNDLKSTVDTHTESIESIDAGISELADEITTIDSNITDLNESQLSQDAAIEDLAEGVAEMMEG